ncbi:RNA 3'-terminal phosphate cyclase [Candidatus Micrarchaeota archaeon]|nr:RNA 3'-terminal phosphate cyclase [Candidatus Micrarchaeota archaeon]
MHSPADAIKLDGSGGAGGGQVLRTALSLSALTCKPFEISNIRASRPKPGLQAQHLASVRAAARLSDAEVVGAELNSVSLKFSPGEISGNNFSFDCGTAGSTMLIAQTLLPIMAFGNGKKEARLVGGTENAFAPTSFFFRHSFLPAVSKMGADSALEVIRFGWYPKGGGEVRISVESTAGAIRPVDLTERGKLERMRGYAIVSNLKAEIAQRMKTRLLKNISEAAFCANVKVELVDAPAIGEGAEAFLLANYGHFHAGFTALGERGKPSEKVAGEAFHNFSQFDKSGACVEQHLSDQLLLYCALAKGRSVLQVERITPHLLTNAGVVSQFLPDAQIAIEGMENEAGAVTVEGIGFESGN